jgi:hypothetical protein
MLTSTIWLFDVELLTIAAVLHLKVQDMPFVMKREICNQYEGDCEYVSDVENSV